MKIPPQLHPDIIQRHTAGQSDAAIARWLATLDPPIHVSRIAILQLRQKHLGTKPRQSQPTSTPSTPSGGKLSGAAGAKVRAARTTQEAADHKKRGPVIIHVPPETRTERAHLHTLGVLLDLQVKVNADTLMGLPEKIRQTATVAQAMSKLQVQAELEKRIEQLEHERAVEVQKFAAERNTLEIERRRNEAERKDLDEAWRKLNEARLEARPA